MKKFLFAIVLFVVGNFLFAEEIGEGIHRYDLSKYLEEAAFRTKAGVLYNNYDYYKKYQYTSFDDIDKELDGGWDFAENEQKVAYTFDAQWVEGTGNVGIIVKVESPSSITLVKLADVQWEEGIKKTTITNFLDFQP